MNDYPPINARLPVSGDLVWHDGLGEVCLMIRWISHSEVKNHVSGCLYAELLTPSQGKIVDNDCLLYSIGVTDRSPHVGDLVQVKETGMYWLSEGDISARRSATDDTLELIRVVSGSLGLVTNIKTQNEESRDCVITMMRGRSTVVPTDCVGVIDLQPLSKNVSI